MLTVTVIQSQYNAMQMHIPVQSLRMAPIFLQPRIERVGLDSASLARGMQSLSEFSALGMGAYHTISSPQQTRLSFVSPSPRPTQENPSHLPQRRAHKPAFTVYIYIKLRANIDVFNTEMIELSEP